MYFDAKQEILKGECSPSLRKVINKILASQEQMDYWTAMSVLDICAVDEDTASAPFQAFFSKICCVLKKLRRFTKFFDKLRKVYSR